MPMVIFISFDPGNLERLGDKWIMRFFSLRLIPACRKESYANISWISARGKRPWSNDFSVCIKNHKPERGEMIKLSIDLRWHLCLL